MRQRQPRQPRQPSDARPCGAVRYEGFDVDTPRRVERRMQAIYDKADFVSLGAVVVPWPGSQA